MMVNKFLVDKKKKKFFCMNYISHSAKLTKEIQYVQ
jgi:hypothetical protein